MAKWILTKLAALTVALATPANAGEGDKAPLDKFPTEESARAYLREFPTGELARLAFLALVEYRLMREYPGLTKDQAMAVFSKKLVENRRPREVAVPIY
jgi:hypothetical protein